MNLPNSYLWIFIFCFLTKISVFSQSINQTGISVDSISLRQCSGTAMPYFYEKRNQSSPPPGYAPFYISHLSRHGARHLTSASKITPVVKVLNDADRQSSLTIRGKELSRFLTELSKQSEGKWGELTTLGKEEQRNIARRMIDNYPAVFNSIQGDSMTIFVISTNIHRCIESMECFTSELKRLVPSLIIRSESGTKFDSILRFFDYNPAYNIYKKEGKWKTEYNNFIRQNTPVKQIKRVLFNSKSSLSDNTLIDFANNLFQIYAILPDMNIQFPMSDIFPIQDARRFWENGNLAQYLRKGPSAIGDDLPINIAAPLLEDFLISARQAIESGGISADLRFAHAETLIPFASLLGIPQASFRTTQLKQVARAWQDFRIAPMAGNIQWIFYRNTSDDIIVKIMLNEKEVFLPIPSDIQPYYHWKDFYTYYKRLIDTLYQKNEVK